MNLRRIGIVVWNSLWIMVAAGSVYLFVDQILSSEVNLTLAIGTFVTFMFALGAIQQSWIRLHSSDNPKYNGLRETIIPLCLESASQVVKNAHVALDDANIAHRRVAIETLLESDDPQAIVALELATKHSTKSVRVDAALALAEKTDCRNELALSGLFEALDSSEPDIQDRALKSIHGIFQAVPSSVSQTAIEGLIKALDEVDDELRWAVEHVLISQCNKTLPYLTKVINHDSSVHLRIAALEAIWITSDCNGSSRKQMPETVPVLVDVLTDYDRSRTPRDQEYVSVSELAGKILTKISSIEELSTYLEDASPLQREHISKVMERITQSSCK